MKEIKLTKGYVTLVDDDKYEQLIKYNWRALPSGRRLHYAARNIRIKGKTKTIFMHRVILGTPKGLLTDHIDGNSLNNCIKNLRIATSQQNSFNKKKKFSSLKYKGITFHKKLGKYQAAHKINGRSYYIGIFNSAVCAALAWDNKAKELHGEFAKLNFPESWYES